MDIVAYGPAIVEGLLSGASVVLGVFLAAEVNRRRGLDRRLRQLVAELDALASDLHTPVFQGSLSPPSRLVTEVNAVQCRHPRAANGNRGTSRETSRCTRRASKEAKPSLVHCSLETATTHTHRLSVDRRRAGRSVDTYSGPKRFSSTNTREGTGRSLHGRCLVSLHKRPRRRATCLIPGT